MKSIEIDDDLYAFIASQTKHIGESASQILRRLLLPEDGAASQGVEPSATSSTPAKTSELKSADVSESVSKPSPAVKTEATPKEAAKTSSASAATKASSTSVKAPERKAPAKAAAKTVRARASTSAKVVKAPSAVSDTSPSSETHSKRDILDAVSKDALSTFTKRVDQFLFVLSAAHKLNAENFTRVESIKGKNRTYFATSKEALLENGSSTNPKAIPDSPFWVVTNNNTAKKTNMLEQVLRNLGYQPDVIETVIARFSSEGK
ncbi:replication initiation negative regulator SeqA [Alteromonas sp. ALT199]|uniref:replication initiation negative regulator SeqA n=1 Tax=unclassified Alteromonas TaxID=2614992 RepID=UPI000450B141|nr:replication initiation negative regulator SeqA [Alteromonas sp. ALT199]MBT3134257.1 replication initiation negative regulator SeqA [Alteromonas sp. ALT199]